MNIKPLDGLIGEVLMMLVEHYKDDIAIFLHSSGSLEARLTKEQFESLSVDEREWLYAHTLPPVLMKSEKRWAGPNFLRDHWFASAKEYIFHPKWNGICIEIWHGIEWDYDGCSPISREWFADWDLPDFVVPFIKRLRR